MSDERTPTRGELLALVERWEVAIGRLESAPGAGGSALDGYISDLANGIRRCTRELRALLEASEACPPSLGCPQCGDRSRAWLLTRRCPECLHRRCSRTATVTELSEIDLAELGRRTGLLRRDEEATDGE